MIFNCPRCSAGHSVPVSMIPNDGLEMSCRRCNESFQVSVAEKTGSSVPPLPGDPTRVGVVNPLDDDMPLVPAPDAGPDTPVQEDPTRDGAPPVLQEDTEDEEDSVRSVDAERTRQGRLDEIKGEGYEIHFSERLHAKTTKQKNPLQELNELEERQEREARELREVREAREARDARDAREAEKRRRNGVDSEHDTTMRMNTPPQVPALIEPQVSAVPEPQKKLPATATGPLDYPPPQQSSSAVSTASTAQDVGGPSSVVQDARMPSQANLYDRIEKGVPVQNERPQIAPERSRPKQWNEPSSYIDPDSVLGRVVKPAKKVAMLLNLAPLPLKVALVVFPAALGIILVITSGRNPWADPVQIPTASDPRSQEIAVAANPDPKIEVRKEPTSAPVKEVAAEAAKAAKEPAAAQKERTPAPAAEAHLPPMKRPGDDTAGDGHAFVLVDHARLRATAEAEGALSAKLDLGQRVKTFDRAGEWVLVMVEPDGPAGFISDRLLGPRKPIALLAKEIEFSNCFLAEDVSLDDCLYQGKQQHDACLQGCGADAGARVQQPPAGESEASSPGMRCAEACRVAFADCQRSCRDDERKGGKKRHARLHRPVK